MYRVYNNNNNNHCAAEYLRTHRIHLCHSQSLWAPTLNCRTKAEKRRNPLPVLLAKAKAHLHTHPYSLSHFMNNTPNVSSPLSLSLCVPHHSSPGQQCLRLRAGSLPAGFSLSLSLSLLSIICPSLSEALQSQLYEDAWGVFSHSYNNLFFGMTGRESELKKEEETCECLGLWLVTCVELRESVSLCLCARKREREGGSYAKVCKCDCVFCNLFSLCHCVTVVFCILHFNAIHCRSEFNNWNRYVLGCYLGTYPWVTLANKNLTVHFDFAVQKIAT